MAGGGGGMLWGFDIVQIFVVKFPAHRHCSEMHKNFPALISFIRVAMVREKSG